MRKPRKSLRLSITERGANSRQLNQSHVDTIHMEIMKSDIKNYKETKYPTHSNHYAVTTCPAVKIWPPMFSPMRIVRAIEMQYFYRLLENPVVFGYLEADGCRLTSDKYLIAMVFAYFKRALFTPEDFTPLNFFIALYLANDIEEEDEDMKKEIFPWALGKKWRKKLCTFFQLRNQLWIRLDFRAMVSRRCCDELMQLEAHHWVWKRQRPFHHGVAVRSPGEDSMFIMKGPYGSPRVCNTCKMMSAVTYHMVPSDQSSQDDDDEFMNGNGNITTIRAKLSLLDELQSSKVGLTNNREE